MEKNGASRAQQQTGQIRLPGVTGNTPAPTAGNNIGAALPSVSLNVIGGQGNLPSSRQAMATTTSSSVYEIKRVSQDHVERDAAAKMLHLYHVGGMQSLGSTAQGCLSHCLPVLLLHLT